MSGEWRIAEAGDRVAVVVAHPDDETFGCGSLIALAHEAGAHVTVICATRGESGKRRPDPLTDAWPLGLLREAELCQAAIVLGVDEVEILDYTDSGFSGAAPPGALISASLLDLAADLEAQLVAIAPDVVVTLDGSDGHRDHCHLRDALALAVARLQRPVRLVHSCLARSVMREWAAIMRAEEPDREHLTVADTDLGRPDEDLVAVDTSAVLATRERAIACHLSQASPFDALPAALRRRFLTIDHIVEMGSEPATNQDTPNRKDTNMHSIINHRPRLAAMAAIALAVAVPTGVAIAHGTHDDGLTGAQRTVIRDATKQFRDVDTAIAAGYIPTDTCVELPGVGGMGFHFVNPALAADAKVDPTMPEVLVHNMTDDGRFRLDAIEYFVADADQDLATDTDRPTLMGHPFDGPMEGHEPGMPIHYDLHAWVYHTNPAGELSAWNPDISCH